MKPMGDMRQHFWLTQDMAKALGVDLVAAFRAGRITQAGYAGMVTRCRHCSDPAGCRRWLGRHETRGSATAPPAYCENIDFLESLAD